MTLDVQTLFVLMLTNVFAIALALPVVMGWRVSPAARCLQASAVAQALGWGSFLLARPVHDRFFSTLWIALLGTGFVLCWHAVDGWLGRRPGRRVLWAAAVLTPIGYGLGFGDYAFRVGWSNFGLAVQMLIVCLACAWPAPGSGRGWRGLVLASLGTMALITAARGVLGAFFTEAYPQLRAQHPVNLVGSLLMQISLMLSTIGLLVGWREEAERELRVRASTDGLTGLLNRHAFSERAARLIAIAQRHGDALTLLMIDIDHFKRINDSRGHAAGDEALKTVGHVLGTSVRSGDLACRWGGEEFCVLLNRTDADAAVEFDRRLRATLAAHSAVVSGAPLGYSSGLAGLRAEDRSLDDLVRRADAMLYRAKSAGRGRLARDDERRAALRPLAPAAS